MKLSFFLLLFTALFPQTVNALPSKAALYISTQATAPTPATPAPGTPSGTVPIFKAPGKIVTSPVPVMGPTATATPVPQAAPASIPGVDLNVSLEKQAEDIFVGKQFRVLVTIVAKPGTKVSFPSAINTGVRFALKKGPDLVSREKLDSGNEKTIYALTLVSFTTDRLMDLKAGRIQKRINDLEMDLTKRKTALTELTASGKDTASTEKYIKSLEQRIRSSNAELAKAIEDYNLPPIPLTIEAGLDTKIIETHEKGKGPRIIISSKLANDPHPALKEPASEENKKAGGPFWKPYRIYEENKKLKYILIGVGGGLVLFLIIFLIVRKILRSRREKQPEIPARPANEIALEKLDSLRRRGQPEDEEVKEFAYNLSEIIREYFGNRYSFYSLEMTTTELLEKLQEIKPQGVSMEVLEDYLDKLDLVKFAKMPLTSDETGHYLDGGYDIVINTWSTYMKEIEEAERLAREAQAQTEGDNSQELPPAKVEKPADPIIPDEDRRWAGLEHSSKPVSEIDSQMKTISESVTGGSGNDSNSELKTEEKPAKPVIDAIPVSGYAYPKNFPITAPTASEPFNGETIKTTAGNPSVGTDEARTLADPDPNTLSDEDKRWAGLAKSESVKPSDDNLSALDSFHKNLTDKGNGKGGEQ